jgi:YHS domain-containing protein
MTITIDTGSARVRRVLIAALAVLFWNTSASAGTSINTGYFGGVAIKGYDPVAYFVEGRAAAGLPEFSYEWLGATWQFANPKHRELFTESPMKYAPQYGGHCAAGAAFGESTADIDPEAWVIVDGKLYLQYSKAALEAWERDRAHRIATADQKWPEIKARLESESGS